MTLKQYGIRLGKIYIHIPNDETVRRNLVKEIDYQIKNHWRESINIDDVCLEYNADYSFEDICQYHGVVTVKAKDINQAIKAIPYSTSWYIFSAKGILNSQSVTRFNFLHFHPGKLPEYRGSTTLYYTVLEGTQLTVTGFRMATGIDTGAVVTMSSFSTDCIVGLNFDYVVDPALRAVTMARLLLEVKENKQKYTTLDDTLVLPMLEQEESKVRTFYKIHPVLRHLVQKKLKN